MAAEVDAGAASYRELFGLFAGLRRANEPAASQCSLLLSASLERVPEEYLQRALHEVTELSGHAVHAINTLRARPAAVPESEGSVSSRPVGRP